MDTHGVVLHVLSTLALIVSLMGNIMINYKKRNGFIVWIISNILWIAVNFCQTPNYQQVIMYVVYAIINIEGYIRWKKEP